MSMSSGSSVSNHSDSTYHDPPGEDDELNDSYDMYNDDSPSHSAHNENACVDQNLSEHVTDDEDDNSVREMYSDFGENIPTSWNHSYNNCDDIETDNLICPGDVLEYCTIDKDLTVKRCSVKTIIDSDHESYIILKNGTILHPKMHSVRKTRFYNECNNELIPNPLAEWHRLDKCILQPGSMNGDNECIGDDGIDGLDDVIDEIDKSEVHTVRTQCRKLNKQR